jgi:glutaredoxin 3
VKDRETRDVTVIIVAFCLVVAGPLQGCGGIDDSIAISTIKGLVGATTRAASESIETDPTRSSMDSAEDGARDGSEITLIEAGEASGLSEPAGTSVSSALYSYIDSRGGAHMVRGLHNVPEPYRKAATSLSGGGGRVINRFDSRVALVRHRRVVPASTPSNPNRGDVTLFSAEWCGACRRAKSFLDERGVAYELRDIDAEPQAKEEVRRVVGSVRIPLLDIDGTYVVGYDPKQIGKLLDEI